ncbi:hypothetical protein SY83_19910 [Paenibacillus swuensis]|uniref:Uncharacterized protein n=1 Tax=Paenibacillus swuensis TaxID=1178515 RepID=A0A172TMG9_9BACL|nr:hypothetical protein SY83_19910 [Paenibacillus swuensis]
MIIYTTLFLTGMSLLTGVHFHFMREKTNLSERICVAFMLCVSTVLGILLIWEFPLIGPAAWVRKWIEFIIPSVK